MSKVIKTFDPENFSVNDTLTPSESLKTYYRQNGNVSQNYCHVFSG